MLMMWIGAVREWSEWSSGFLHLPVCECTITAQKDVSVYRWALDSGP